MAGGALGRVIAQEKSDGDGITATFGDASPAGNVFKEANHEHFETNHRVHARPAPRAIRIGRGADLASFVAELERSKRPVQFGIEEEVAGCARGTEGTKNTG